MFWGSMCQRSWREWEFPRLAWAATLSVNIDRWGEPGSAGSGWRRGEIPWVFPKNMVISHANCLTLLGNHDFYQIIFHIFSGFQGVTFFWGVKRCKRSAFIANEEHSSHGLELMQVRLGRFDEVLVCPHQALKNGCLPKQNGSVFNMYFFETNFWKPIFGGTNWGPKWTYVFLCKKPTRIYIELLLPNSRCDELFFQFWWFDWHLIFFSFISLHNNSINVSIRYLAIIIM